MAYYRKSPYFTAEDARRFINDLPESTTVVPNKEPLKKQRKVYEKYQDLVISCDKRWVQCIPSLHTLYIGNSPYKTRIEKAEERYGKEWVNMQFHALVNNVFHMEQVIDFLDYALAEKAWLSKELDSDYVIGSIDNRINKGKKIPFLTDSEVRDFVSILEKKLEEFNQYKMLVAFVDN